MNNVSDKYLAMGWADFFDEDYTIILPLLLKYAHTNSFYYQIEPKSNDYLNSLYDQDKIDLIKNINSKSEDHGFLHFAFIYTLPEYDGVNTPSNDDLRVARVDNTNEWNHDVDETLNDTISALAVTSSLQLDSSVGLKTWVNLTDADCLNIRQNISAFKCLLDYQNGQQLLEALDYLSNRYCGTSGLSVDNYIDRNPNTIDSQPISGSNPIIGGIYTGANTTQNHEIWERVETIMAAYKLEVHKIGNVQKFWGTPGGTYSGFMYQEQSGTKRYSNKNYTKLACGFSKYESTILDTQRSFINILDSNNYLITMAAMSTGYANAAWDSLQKQESQRIFKKNLNFTRIDYLGDGFDNSLRIFDNTILTAKYNELIASTNIIQALYDYTKTDAAYTGKTDGRFSSFVEMLVTYIAWGIIPDAVGDSGVSTDEQRASIKLNIECLFKLCSFAKIKTISHVAAFELVKNNNLTITNYFPNYKLDNTLKAICNTSVNVQDYPDGWNHGEILNETVNGSLQRIIHIENTGGTTFYPFVRQYAMGYSNATISFYAKGTGELRIKKILNKDDYTPSPLISASHTGFTTIKTIVINNGNYALVSDTFIIPIEDDVIYGTPADIEEEMYQYHLQGKDNKIIGLVFEFKILPTETLKMAEFDLAITE